MTCNSRPRKNLKIQNNKTKVAKATFYYVRKNFLIGGKPVKAITPTNIYIARIMPIFIQEPIPRNKSLFYFSANIFSGVFILQTAIIKSINAHIAVIQIPTIVHVNKNIAIPDPILPA